MQADAVGEVMRFYDSHPYPPPRVDLDGVRDLWADPGRQRAEHFLFWPTRAYTEGFDILVAGCGTSQAAQYALRHPAARVVGIDISSTGLRHTEELQGAYNLTNLSLNRLAVEQVGELGRSFDKIVCTGVLHHLPNPDAGLRALRSALKVDGAMHLMVYATYGRTGIYMLQEYARRLGIGTSDREIQDLAALLVELPVGHPLEHLLREAPDFRRKAALADALLNPLDRAYTVPELYAFLERNGVTFGRWLRQAPYLPQCGSLASTPHAKRLARLSAPEQHAAAELFRGTIVRHSLIAYRNDRPHRRPLDFDDGPWLAYVPLRLPRTRCVEERLPQGAAAVLINQSHTYPDLYLPVDALEKRIFEAIDGKRTIGQILAAVIGGESNHLRRQRARRLFERLWQYDQVVFENVV
jgi:SAM-dependent methyltransferase